MARTQQHRLFVMAGLVPAICALAVEARMAGTSPAMSFAEEANRAVTLVGVGNSAHDR